MSCHSAPHIMLAVKLDYSAIRSKRGLRVKAYFCSVKGMAGQGRQIWIYFMIGFLDR